jgi:two-component system CheB/CheR fusion protein
VESVIGIVRNITERRMLQQTIVDISTRQQRRIGQDLHDELGQLLTGIGFRLVGLSHQLSESDSIAAQDAGEINTLVEQAIAQTRILAEGLNPVTLDVHGLQAGLERLAINSEKLYNMECRYYGIETTATWSEETATQVYRIAQEAVNNAIKHGNATQIIVSLKDVGDRFELRIHDNGTGFDPELKSLTGLGLRIMKYRAGLIGAQFTISSTEADGTLVICLF